MERPDLELAAAFMDISAVFSIVAAAVILPPSVFDLLAEECCARLEKQGFSEEIISDVKGRMSMMREASKEFYNGQYT